MKFKVGDMVRCLNAYSMIEKGMTGVIVRIDCDAPRIGVQWNNFTDGNSCDGSTSIIGSGYFLDECDLILETDPNDGVILMGKFRVGDRVRCIEKYDVVEKGMVGVVKFIDGSPTFGVIWDGLTKGHILRHAVSDKSGYFVPGRYLDFDSDPNDMEADTNG